jgi:serine phosphatase RsbU (regulator of sigma subunit)
MDRGSASADDLVAELLSDLATFQGNGVHDDDITVVALQLREETEMVRRGNGS